MISQGIFDSSQFSIPTLLIMSGIGRYIKQIKIDIIDIIKETWIKSACLNASLNVS